MRSKSRHIKIQSSTVDNEPQSIRFNNNKKLENPKPTSSRQIEIDRQQEKKKEKKNDLPHSQQQIGRNKIIITETETSRFEEPGQRQT